jgi:hypothetical protein
MLTVNIGFDGKKQPPLSVRQRYTQGRQRQRDAVIFLICGRRAAAVFWGGGPVSVSDCGGRTLAMRGHHFAKTPFHRRGQKWQQSKLPASRRVRLCTEGQI